MVFYLLLRGHSKSLKNDIIRKLGYGFLLVLYSKYGRIVSEIFSVKEWRNLEKWVIGSSKLLK